MAWEAPTHCWPITRKVRSVNTPSLMHPLNNSVSLCPHSSNCTKMAAGMYGKCPQLYSYFMRSKTTEDSGTYCRWTFIHTSGGMGWSRSKPNLQSCPNCNTCIIIQRHVSEKSLLMAAGILNLLYWGWVCNKYGMLPPTSIAVFCCSTSVPLNSRWIWLLVGVYFRHS